MPSFSTFHYHLSIHHPFHTNTHTHLFGLTNRSMMRNEKRANLVMSRMEKQMKKQYQMAYISHDKLWRSENYNTVSATDRVQDINLNQLKLKKNDTYKKDEKITKTFEAVNE